MTVNQRVDELRKLMADRKIDAYIVPTSDPHQSEYLADYYKTREFISGFTGSAGTAVVTKNRALLWTDSRYFLQAESELSASYFELMKMGVEGVPTIEDFLLEEVGDFGKIGFDGRCFSIADYKKLSKSMGSRALIYDIDYISQIWTDRPPLPKKKARVYDEKYAGESLSSKIERLREKLRELDCDYTFIGAPEDICYLLNIRGGDVDFNPVVMSYLLVSQEEVHLCLDEEKLDLNTRDYLEENGVRLHSYEYIYNLLREIRGKSRVYLDPTRTNLSIFDSLNSNVRITFGINLSSKMKAVKNETEIENIKKAYRIDAVTLVKFFNRVEVGAKTGTLTELLAARKLHDLREENESFLEDSFETIAGYKDNAAIVHYDPEKGISKTLKEEGLLLVDSGGHYLEGTTDITRTIALGKLTDEEKKDYTLVLKSHIALMTAIFKEGTTGARLDILAKEPLWKAGKDFFHGTGHGVGHMLTVHEGPQAIRETDQNHFYENMTSSVEPGLYIAGSHGIRLESEVYVKKAFENDFGKFMEFGCFTYVPLDTRPVVKEMLDPWELDWLNAYNAKCQELIAPSLEGDDLLYLKERCRKI